MLWRICDFPVHIIKVLPESRSITRPPLWLCYWYVVIRVHSSWVILGYTNLSREFGVWLACKDIWNIRSSVLVVDLKVKSKRHLLYIFSRDGLVQVQDLWRILEYYWQKNRPLKKVSSINESWWLEESIYWEETSELSWEGRQRHQF